MGEEMGLAASYGAQMGQQSGNPNAGQMPSVEEIAALLAQGITPDELQAAGVPVELIKQAIAMLKQQAPMQGGSMGPSNVPMDEQGLAALAGMGGM